MNSGMNRGRVEEVSNWFSFPDWDCGGRTKRELQRHGIKHNTMENSREYSMKSN